MTPLILASVTLAFLGFGDFPIAEAENIRVDAGRVETPDSSSQSSSISHLVPDYEEFFKNAENPSTNLRTYDNSKSNLSKEKEEFVMVLEAANGIVASELLMMSMPTIVPTTAMPSTIVPTTAMPSTIVPTTAMPSTIVPTTAMPSTSVPTTVMPSTIFPTTKMPSTSFPTASAPSITIKGVPVSNSGPTETMMANFRTYGNSMSKIFKKEEEFVKALEAANGMIDSELLMMSMPTSVPTTKMPSTIVPTTATPSTIVPTTATPSTIVPTTATPSTSVPTTATPSTSVPTTATPSTSVPTTAMPSTSFPTTTMLSTSVPTTAMPSTSVPTTKMPFTSFPTTGTPSITIKGVPISTTWPTETMESPTPTPTKKTSTTDPTSGNAASNCGISADERSSGILSALGIVADSLVLRDLTTAQGLATQWLIEKDGMNLCPTITDKLVQRWVLAVMYFSTNGGEWFKCSGNPSKTDSCGVESPFVGSTRFLSDVDECQWAGVTCNRQLFVTRIEYQENNLVGSIATEIGLLSDLIVLKMKMGGLTGTIPSEIGQLDELMTLHLDANDLIGTVPAGFTNLRGLTQLDLDSNNLEGHIDIIGSFPELEFLQLHSNGFTGSVPDSLGEATSLKTFTLHDTMISGIMPDSVCELVESGVLTRMIADCSSMNPDIICTCCTDCRGQ